MGNVTVIIWIFTVNIQIITIPHTLIMKITGMLKQLQCILVENTTFDDNFNNFTLNVTKFGMLIDSVETILLRNCEFLSYQNV